MQRVGWVLVLAVVAGSLTVALTTEDPPATLDERAYSLKESTLCPICDGQNVLESNAPVANAIRQQIDDFVDDGFSDDEIRTFLAGQYGGDVNASPPKSGFAALVWVIPVVAVAVGALLLGLAFRGWRQGRGVDVSDADRQLVARELAERQQ